MANEYYVIRNVGGETWYMSSTTGKKRTWHKDVTQAIRVAKGFKKELKKGEELVEAPTDLEKDSVRRWLDVLADKLHVRNPYVQRRKP